jgi:Cu/Ag efflux protein CusF
MDKGRFSNSPKIRTSNAKALWMVIGILIAPAASPLWARGAPTISGEVLKVDTYSGKITIKHGPIENLGAPAGTDDFKVAEPMMLNALWAGEKFNFTADRPNGQLMLSTIRPPG